MGFYSDLYPPPLTLDGGLGLRLERLAGALDQLERRAAGLDWGDDFTNQITVSSGLFSDGGYPLNVQITAPVVGSFVGIYAEFEYMNNAASGFEVALSSNIWTNKLVSYQPNASTSGGWNRILTKSESYFTGGIEGADFPKGAFWVFRAPQQYMTFTMVHRALSGTTYLRNRRLYAIRL